MWFVGKGYNRWVMDDGGKAKELYAKGLNGESVRWNRHGRLKLRTKSISWR